MKYPITEFFNDESLINKDSFTRGISDHLDKVKLLEDLGVATCLFIFIKNSELPKEILDRCQPLYNFISGSNENWAYIYDNKFILAQSPLGGSASGGFMEELGFMGIKNFFACGSAGQIDCSFDSSDFVLIKDSIRDEGTSYHYLKPSIKVETNEELTNFIANFLTDNNYKYKLATSWCTDAFFRETPNAINKRLKQGAVSVEMESAGWSAIAKYRNYKFAQLLYFSDAVKQEGWSYAPNKKELKMFIIKLMIECVSSFVEKGN